MTLHKEGIRIIVIAGIIVLLLGALTICLPVFIIIKILILLPVFIFYVLILWFFRVPKREINSAENNVISPADGKIVAIEKTTEKEYFKAEMWQISIFMSPLNVHLNTYPVDGKIVYTKYHPGQYLVAWHPKSSSLNERSTVVIEDNQSRKILVRQIAGAVARRIITYSKTDEQIKQGDEMGFIRFGSRVDIFVPLSSEIKCAINDIVRSRITTLALIK